MPLHPFHLAIPVNNLESALTFYHEKLGCPLGRSCEQWIDFDFFGHQLVVHLAPEEMNSEEKANNRHNTVDGDEVPVRHFGMVLDWETWEQLQARLKKLRIHFFLEPKIRFEGDMGEQGTFFIKDPSGNALEFKAFKNQDQLFAH